MLRKNSSLKGQEVPDNTYPLNAAAYKLQDVVGRGGSSTVCFIHAASLILSKQPNLNLASPYYCRRVCQKEWLCLFEGVFCAGDNTWQAGAGGRQTL